MRRVYSEKRDVHHTLNINLIDVSVLRAAASGLAWCWLGPSATIPSDFPLVGRSIHRYLNDTLLPRELGVSACVPLAIRSLTATKKSCRLSLGGAYQCVQFDI